MCSLCKRKTRQEGFPRFGRVFDKTQFRQRRRKRTARLSDKTHTGGAGRAVRLPGVAEDAGGNQVLPSIASAQRLRYHMVKRQLRGRKTTTAILAGEVVAGKNK